MLWASASRREIRYTLPQHEPGRGCDHQLRPSYIEVEYMQRFIPSPPHHIVLTLFLSQVVSTISGCGGPGGQTEIVTPTNPGDSSSTKTNPKTNPTWESPGSGAEGAMFVPPDMDEANDQFGILIERTYVNDDEAQLIKEAEETQPVRENVLLVIGSPNKQEQIGVDPEAPLWWYATFDGVRIPFAITADALTYYVNVIKAFEAGDFADSDGINMLKAYVKYEASVEYAEVYQLGESVHHDVALVQMKLSWSQYCGPECAMGFFKNRTVVFSASGDLIEVLEDGSTQYVVS